jgi:HSP20 family protein
MYPGTACNRNIPARKTKALHFKETEDGQKSVNPVHTIPDVNISETATDYFIALATPGLHRDDFSIEIAQSVIAISGKKEIGLSTCVNDRCEYNYTDWTRAFTLPADADALLAHAEYQTGELVIHIPRNNTGENKTRTTIYVY